MHNIPYLGDHNIRRFENFPHAMVHMLLWICHPWGSNFNSSASQSGRAGVVFVNKFRHYIQLQPERSRMSATDALRQIRNSHYDFAFPRNELASLLPAFFYGAKLTDRSTDVTIAIALVRTQRISLNGQQCKND